MSEGMQSIGHTFRRATYMSSMVGFKVIGPIGVHMRDRFMLLAELSMIFYDNFCGPNMLLLLLHREWVPKLNMGS